MVNPGKRMRKLHPLLDIRNGPGAVLLPPPPAPQLVGIQLRKRKISGQHVTQLQKNLQQLKFHNPALPITCVEKSGEGMMGGTLTLQFEADNTEALLQIPGIVRGRLPAGKFNKSTSEEELGEALRNQSANFRDAPGKDGILKNAKAKTDNASHDQTAETLPRPPHIETVARNADSTAGPKTTYRRTINIGLRGHTVEEIWEFFRQRTGCQKIPTSQEDIEQRRELDEFFAKAEIERQRVKAGIDAMKKEKEDLRRAKGEAEKLQADAM